ncbi:MAG: phosphopantetheine adenylyltransferase [Burkholderiaceae bacterium]
MQKIISAMLIIAAIIHFLPVAGVLGSERLSTLYGISFSEPNLAILMRHRAVLFGLLGCFLIYAVFQPQLQPLAFIAGLISVISFLWLAWSIGDYNALIKRVVIADVVALVCLLFASGIYVFSIRQS